MAATKIKPVKSTLSKALDYIENPDKTDGKMLILILSRLVDTFSSRILYPMLLLSRNHSIAVVLSWEEAPIRGADPPVIPIADEISPNEGFQFIRTHLLSIIAVI